MKPRLTDIHTQQQRYTATPHEPCFTQRITLRRLRRAAHSHLENILQSPRLKLRHSVTGSLPTLSNARSWTQVTDLATRFLDGQRRMPRITLSAPRLMTRSCHSAQGFFYLLPKVFNFLPTHLSLRQKCRFDNTHIYLIFHIQHTLNGGSFSPVLVTHLT